MSFGRAAFDYGWTKGMGSGGGADLEDEIEHGPSFLL